VGLFATVGKGSGLTVKRRLGVAAGCDLTDSELFITDMDAMIELLHNNVALNGMKDRPEIKVELLDWCVFSGCNCAIHVAE
jgi:hypothetical protein